MEEVGRAFPDDALDGDDLVHTDFHAGNVLVDADGAITGVIDWDGARRGDAAFDLFTLRFDLAHRAPWLHVDVPETVALRCWAHMSLRLVDWAIRHFSASEVTYWLEVAERLRP
ncbi:phosphotransferase [Nonomuraea fastidiosa]|uniref:phosphotransferase n=1 Tax=Nonomuraea TaxID=83681 RepID=UPI003414AC3C